MIQHYTNYLPHFSAFYKLLTSWFSILQITCLMIQHLQITCLMIWHLQITCLMIQHFTELLFGDGQSLSVCRVYNQDHKLKKKMIMMDINNLRKKTRPYYWDEITTQAISLQMMFDVKTWILLLVMHWCKQHCLQKLI